MKYAIQYKTNAKKTDYIRDCDLTSDYRRPMLTPNVNMVSPKWIFNTEEDAMQGVLAIIKHCTSLVTIQQEKIKEFKSFINNNMEYEKYSLRQCKHFADSTRYSIVEWKPEFKFKKSSKSCYREWVDGSAREYCNECGASTHATSYYIISGSKLCVFCLEQLGKQATAKIDELAKEDPNIRDNHHNMLFVEAME